MSANVLKEEAVIIQIPAKAIPFSVAILLWKLF